MEPEAPDHSAPPLSETYKLLAAVAVASERLSERVCDRLDRLEVAVERLTTELRELGEDVAPIAAGSRARAAIGARTFTLLQKLQLTQALAIAIVVVAGAMGLPLFVGGMLLATRDPGAVLAFVAALFGLAKGA